MWASQTDRRPPNEQQLLIVIEGLLQPDYQRNQDDAQVYAHLQTIATWDSPRVHPGLCFIDHRRPNVKGTPVTVQDDNSPGALALSSTWLLASRCGAGSPAHTSH
jgi:hypothetical protein